jgi:D-sedoheptulose 7-phosphate isomerase
MKNDIIIKNLIERYPALVAVERKIRDAAESLILCYQQKGKVLICGNGGSCSDSDHIVGEFMKGFETNRPIESSLKMKLSKSGQEGNYIAEKLQQGLPAISLAAHNTLITAIANDIDANLIFAQQVVGYGNPEDILIGISSSGNSQNIVNALITAKAKGMVTIDLTGESGGKMKTFCDILINVPEKKTSSVQELHLPVYHVLCQIVEDHFFGEKN